MRPSACCLSRSSSPFELWIIESILWPSFAASYCSFIFLRVSESSARSRTSWTLYFAFGSVLWRSTSSSRLNAAAFIVASVSAKSGGLAAVLAAVVEALVGATGLVVDAAGFGVRLGAVAVADRGRRPSTA